MRSGRIGERVTSVQEEEGKMKHTGGEMCENDAKERAGTEAALYLVLL